MNNLQTGALLPKHLQLLHSGRQTERDVCYTLGFTARDGQLIVDPVIYLLLLGAIQVLRNARSDGVNGPVSGRSTVQCCRSLQGNGGCPISRTKHYITLVQAPYSNGEQLNKS